MRRYIPNNAYLVPDDAECVFKGVIYDVYQWQQKMYDGSSATFEMLKRPDTLKVIAIHDGKIIITEQEQPGLGHFYDLPGGRHDRDDEDELEGAKRELLEETGMSFRNWKLIYAKQPAPKIESFFYIFIATDLIATEDQNLDSGEKIEVHLMTFDQVKSMTGKPETRYLPEEILDKVTSIEQLADFAELL